MLKRVFDCYFWDSLNLKTKTHGNIISKKKLSFINW